MRSINKEEIHYLFNEMRQNNQIGFNTLYTNYHDLVYNIGFSVLKNKEDTEEVVQTTFMKIWNLDKEKLPTQNETSWLYSTTKNESINYIRSKKKEFDIEQVYYIGEDDKEILNIISKDQYNRIISKLDKEEQEIVSLKVLSDMTFSEIANILNMSENTVKWKYYKAINTLRKILSSFAVLGTTILFVFSIIQKTFSSKPENNTTPINLSKPDEENVINSMDENVTVAIPKDEEENGNVTSVQNTIMKNELKRAVKDAEKKEDSRTIQSVEPQSESIQQPETVQQEVQSQEGLQQQETTNVPQSQSEQVEQPATPSKKEDESSPKEEENEEREIFPAEKENPEPENTEEEELITIQPIEGDNSNDDKMEFHIEKISVRTFYASEVYVLPQNNSNNNNSINRNSEYVVNATVIVVLMSLMIVLGSCILKRKVKAKKK